MNKNDSLSPYFVLDFDRTLGNTDKFHTVLERVIERETTLLASALRDARVKAESEGQSFDTIDHLRHFLVDTRSEKTWMQIQRVFIAEAQQEDMLEPHARELLAILDNQEIPYGIVTYGGEAWQLAKIEGANLLSVPHIVTHIKEKGVLFTGWKQPSGEFIIPPALTQDFIPLSVPGIVFLDDKPVSFQNIPDGVKGIRVHPVAGPEVIAHEEISPPGVTDVTGIKGAIKLLF